MSTNNVINAQNRFDDDDDLLADPIGHSVKYTGCKIPFAYAKSKSVCVPDPNGKTDKAGNVEWRQVCLPRHASWQVIVKRFFSEHKILKDKKKAPYIIMARLTPDVKAQPEDSDTPHAFRKLTSIKEQSGAILDVDGGVVSYEEVSKLLKALDWNYALYTSFSYDPLVDGKQHKYRIVIPSGVFETGDYKAFVTGIAEELGLTGNYDAPASQDRSHIMYLPSCPRDRIDEALLETYVDGSLPDTNHYIKAGWVLLGDDGHKVHEGQSNDVCPPPTIEDAEGLLAHTAEGYIFDKYYNSLNVEDEVLEKGGRSEAAFEFINMLVFICGGHYDTVIEMFKRSEFDRKSGYSTDGALKYSVEKAIRERAGHWYDWGRKSWSEKLPSWNMFPHVKRNAEGAVTGLHATLENYTLLLNTYEIYPHFNVIKKKYVINPIDKFPQPDDAITQIKSLCTLNNIPKTEVSEFVYSVARRNPVNPVLDYLTGLPEVNDGHIQALADCVGVPDDEIEIRNIMFRLWFIQACAAADRAEKTPNRAAQPKYEYVLTFHGAQGGNKTKFFNELMPKHLSGYVKDGVALDPNNRDSIWKATSYWIVELGELDTTFRKADLSALKAFFSERDDMMRLPYAHSMSEFPRQTVYCGSVNDVEFLRDTTGNRRYWPLMTLGIKLPSVADINIDNVWAEAWRLYKAGEQWWPTDKEEAKIEKIRSSVFEEWVTGSVEDGLDTLYPDLSPEYKRKVGTERLRATDIMRDRLNYLNPTKKDFMDLKVWMKRHNLRSNSEPDCVKHGALKWVLPVSDLLG